MCLYSRDGKRLIAEEDIEVYKILDTCEYPIKTPFFSFPIFFNGEGKCRLVSRLGVYIRDFQFKSVPKDCPFVVREGIHAFNSKFAAIAKKERFGIGYKIYKAYVPKDAEYIIGSQGDIVSTELIILNELVEV